MSEAQPDYSGPVPSQPGAVARRVLRVAYWLAIPLFGGLLLYNSVNLEGRFSPDSVFYIDTARNLAGGNGLVRSMAGLDRLMEGGQALPLPMTQWGPLFPVLIALATKLGFSAPGAALGLSALFFICLMAPACLLVAKVFDEAAAVLAAAFLLHLGPLRLAASHAWSETAGAALLLLCLWLLTLSAAPGRVASKRASFMIAVLAGLVGGLAFSTRYALLPLLPMGWLVLFRRRGLGNALRLMGCYTAGFLGAALPVVARNLYHSGNIGGAPSGTGRGTLAAGFSEMARALWYSFQTESTLVRCCIAALVIVALGRGAKFFRGGASLRIRAVVGEKGLVLFLWPVLYLAFLIYAESRVRVDPIDTRLTLPAVLVLCLFGLALLVRAARVPATGAYVLGLVLAAAAIVPEWATAQSILNVGALPPHDMNKTIRRSPALAWLVEHAAPGDLIVAEEGLDFPLYLGPIATAFFVREPAPEPPLEYGLLMTYLDRIDACRRYGRIFLSIRARASAEEKANPQDGGFIASLATGNLTPYPRLRALAQLENGRIYELTCGSEP